MRVLIDARMAEPGGHGFGQYVRGLARGLVLLQESEGVLPYEPVFLVPPGASSLEPWNFFKSAECSLPFLHPLEPLLLSREVARSRVDAYHSTTFSSILRCPVPWISTVHDLNHLHFGSWTKKLYYNKILRPFLEGAAQVVTVSEFSRDEIAQWLAWPVEKIEVIQNPIEPLPQYKNTDEVLKRFNLEKNKYFLTLAGSKPHKNLAVLFSSYRRYRQIAGPGAWPLVVSTHSGGDQPGTVCIGNLDGPSAWGLLQSSGALVSPSLYEGFGRPVVEGVVAGVPVIASDIAPHREGLNGVLSQSIIFVPPQDEGAWTQAFVRVEAGEVVRPLDSDRHLISQRFQPIHMAKGMDRLYRRVLDLSLA